MSEPPTHLDSLEIRGFRAISKLVLPTLGQVNLFVGKNNVGKTSLLEAVRLYVSRNPDAVLATLARDRDAAPRSSLARSVDDFSIEEVNAAVRRLQQLFHGTFSSSEAEPLKIGPAGLHGQALVIRAPWASEGTDLWMSDDSSSQEVFLAPESTIVEFERGDDRWPLSLQAAMRGVSVSFGRFRSGGTTFVPPGGLDTVRIAEMWDTTAVAGGTSEVEAALRSIVPNLERVHVVGDPASRSRSVAIALRDTTRPIPLRSMGDGLNRIFGIALALVRSPGGFVLIDEVENGLHYSVHEEVWRTIFDLAARLDVQVFATTHSWDCITAFQQVIDDGRAAGEGVLYRIERTAEEFRAIPFSAAELALATKFEVEIR